MTYRTKLILVPLLMSSLAFACSGSSDDDNRASGGSSGDGDGDVPASGGRPGDGDGDGDRPTGGKTGNGDGDGDGGLGGLGGQGGSGNPSDAALAEVCQTRCATTVSLQCPENDDQDECEVACTSGAVAGCEDEWLALKSCESMLSADGFQCLSYLGYNFVDLSLSGHTACVEEFEANDSCEVY